MFKKTEYRNARKGDKNLLMDSLLLTNKIVPNFFSTELLSHVVTRSFKSVLIDNIFAGAIFSSRECKLEEYRVVDIRMFIFGYLNGLESEFGSLFIPKRSPRRIPLNNFDLNDLKRAPAPTKCDKGNSLDSVLVLGPEKRNLKVLEAIAERGFKVIRHENKIDSSIDTKGLRLILVNGYEHRIPSSFLMFVSSPIVNLHATFLPFGRGIGTTLYAALLNQPFGISMHIINTDDIDVGPVIYRKKIDPGKYDTTRSFYSILIDELDACLVSNIDDLLHFKFVGVEQSSLADEEIPYFSRENFENLVKILPHGYDTKLSLLNDLGSLMHSNRFALTELERKDCC